MTYRQKEGTYKLNVKKIDAYIYHYGWVRPPRYMEKKAKQLDINHKGQAEADRLYAGRDPEFDYGNMNWYKRFKGTHPKVMEQFISNFDWADKLHFEKDYKISRKKLKHEHLKYRILTFLEQNITRNHPFNYSNWKMI